MVTIEIDRAAAQRLHEKFTDYMEKQPNGGVFIDFDHKFLRDDEVDYKKKVYKSARAALDLSMWYQWKESSPGTIIDAVKEACDGRIARNLMIAKYGKQNGPQKALYRVQTPEAIRLLEEAIYDLFLSFGDDEAMFGLHFDKLAYHLREHSLGCNWTFMSYLSFLAFERRCFPIRPSQFDKVLATYGIDKGIAGHVSWNRYERLLGLADAVREYLEPMHGQATAVQIQSYLWVIGYLLEIPDDPIAPDYPSDPDFAAEYKTRLDRARRRELVGLRGERLVMDAERHRLTESGRQDLAKRVRLVSVDGSNAGYDIESYAEDGTPLHIEVKATEWPRSNDPGFYLSDNEKRTAESDEYWTVFRVWSVFGKPEIENIGNVCTSGSETWSINPASWFVTVKGANGIPDTN